MEIRISRAIHHANVIANILTNPRYPSKHLPHWQVVGLPVVPKRAATMAEAMRREDCLFCKMLAYEKETNRRIVAETEHFLALTPYAGRFAYELWLAPKAHQRDFGEMSAEERQELAAL